MIKCVLFDLDGVILDSEYGCFSLMSKTLETLGVNVSVDELLNYIGYSSPQIAKSIVSKYNLPMSAEEFMVKNRKTGSFYADFEDLCPLDNCQDFLITLKQDGLKTAVVSSTGSKSVLTALNRIGILQHFNAVVCGDMVQNTKPSPEGYLKAAELLAVIPENCLVIEDSPIGICAGLSAGMKVVGFSGASVRQDTSQAHIQVDSFSKLLELYKMGLLTKGT